MYIKAKHPTKGYLIWHLNRTPRYPDLHSYVSQFEIPPHNSRNHSIIKRADLQRIMDRLDMWHVMGSRPFEFYTTEEENADARDSLLSLLTAPNKTFIIR